MKLTAEQHGTAGKTVQPFYSRCGGEPGDIAGHPPLDGQGEPAVPPERKDT